MNRFLLLLSIALLIISCTTEYPELPNYAYSFRADSLGGTIGTDSVIFKKGWCKTGTLMVQGKIFDIEFAGDSLSALDTADIKRVRYALDFAIPLDSSVHYLSAWNTEVTLYSVNSTPLRIDSGAVQIISIDQKALKMVARIDMWKESSRLSGTFTLPILK